MFIRNLLHSPYQYGATILAKALVGFATVTWSIIVLVKKDALMPFPAYRRMLDLLPEDVWAGALLLVSAILLYRLIHCYQPRRIGALGYAFISGFWAHIWWGIVIQPGPFWPASFSAVSCVLILALFAFISNPKSNLTRNGGE